MVASRRHGASSRKLREEMKAEWIYIISKPAPSDIAPAARLHHQNVPKPRVQILQSTGDISHLKH